MPPLSFVQRPLLFPPAALALDAFHGPNLLNSFRKIEGSLGRYAETLSAFERAVPHRVSSGSRGALLQYRYHLTNRNAALSAWEQFLYSGRRRLLGKSDFDLRFYLGQAFNDYAFFHEQLAVLAVPKFTDQSLAYRTTAINRLRLRDQQLHSAYTCYPPDTADLTFAEHLVQELFLDASQFLRSALHDFAFQTADTQSTFAAAYENYTPPQRILQLLFGDEVLGRRGSFVLEDEVGKRESIQIAHVPALIAIMSYLLCLSQQVGARPHRQRFKLEVDFKREEYYNFIFWESRSALDNAFQKSPVLLAGLDCLVKAICGDTARVKNISDDMATTLSIKIPQVVQENQVSSGLSSEQIASAALSLG